jgi:hypothetical protein
MLREEKRMLTKGTVCFSTLASLLVTVISLSPVLQAADTSEDSKEVSELLSQAKTQAARLKDDAYQMQIFTQSQLSAETRATKINAIRDDVNAVVKTVGKLNDASNAASPWQKTAIDRINPLLREMADHTTSMIDHFNKEKGLDTQQHKDYVKTNAELADEMSKMISEFVDYGKTKAKFDKLQQQLEVSER